MVDETEQLRDEIDEHRQSVGQTVDQIENRVNPYKATRRAGSRIRRRLTDMKDAVMGNDEPYYPDTPRNQSADYDRSLVDRAKRRLEDMPEPAEYIRRQTRGNPLAAGMISFGVGMLIGSLLPETQAEREVVSDLEPSIQGLADEARTVGREAAEDLRQPAREAVESVKESATEAAKDVAGEARATAEGMRGDTN